ncbi:major facilitator superfamily domain-containing protein [Cercophora newfieldiana]|uniref:Major facilitator superfamily domain-containing protein n=1 Tax=Cercophora newfieldiana TaxID=92897 RepID=A0AA40CVW2_9PEZI|nr:major facilitator superfamily domain-containing protein [Cercophora newfieldiana]
MTNTIDDTNERAPLLGSNHHSNGHGGHHEPTLQAQTPESHTLPPATLPIAPRRRILIISAIFALSIILSISGAMGSTAGLQALEDIICRRVHGPGHLRLGRDKRSFDDDPCKDNAIQGEIALLIGWDAMFALLPGLFLTVPFGAVADRYGRVLVLGMVLLGFTLGLGWFLFVCLMDGALDLRLIWLSNLGGLLGGGPVVFNSMLFTMIADISTDAQRSTAFFYIGTVLMGGLAVAQPITYLAMQRGKWFTFGLSVILMGVSTVVAFCVPETLDKKAAARVDPVPLNKESVGLLARLRDASVHTLRVIRWLFWEQKLVGFLLLSLTFEVFGKTVVGIQKQYISKRYHLSFAEASLAETVNLVTIIVVLMAILPYISHLVLTRYGWSARTKDLRLAQASALLTATGCILIGVVQTLPLLTASMIIYSFGTGYTFMIRGLMTSLAGSKDIGLLYSSIAFVDSFAMIIGSPLYSYLFKVGLGLGGGWIGLPYHFAGVVLVGAAVLVGAIRGAYVDVGEEQAGESEDLLGRGANDHESGAGEDERV